MIVLTLYSRPDCHLCDEMLEALAPLVDGKAEIEIVDIDEDEALVARYGLAIPVLTAGDLELSRYRLDPDRVAAHLAAHANHRTYEPNE